MQDKQTLREKYREIRSSIGAEERVKADTKIAVAFWETDEYREAGTVFSFVSIGPDVDTISTFVKAWEDGKKVAIPMFRQENKRMEFYEVASVDAMHHGQFGSRDEIGERSAATPTDRDVCIVPALCVDEQGHRLGTGGGYYDRWLGDFPGTAVALVHDVQVSPDPIPQDEHDVAMGLVVTEARVIRP